MTYARAGAGRGVQNAALMMGNALLGAGSRVQERAEQERAYKDAAAMRHEARVDREADIHREEQRVVRAGQTAELAERRRQDEWAASRTAEVEDQVARLTAEGWTGTQLVPRENATGPIGQIPSIRYGERPKSYFNTPGGTIDEGTGEMVPGTAPAPDRPAAEPRGIMVEDEGGQFLIDPVQGDTISSFGPRPRSGSTEDEFNVDEFLDEQEERGPPSGKRPRRSWFGGGQASAQPSREKIDPTEGYPTDKRELDADHKSGAITDEEYRDYLALLRQKYGVAKP